LSKSGHRFCQQVVRFSFGGVRLVAQPSIGSPMHAPRLLRKRLQRVVAPAEPHLDLLCSAPCASSPAVPQRPTCTVASGGAVADREPAEASSRCAEPLRAAVESRRSRAGPNGTADARRAAAARGSPVAYGAKARNAGPTSRAEAGSRRRTAGWFGSTGDRPAAARRATSRLPCARAGRPG
jgi:hypothetical protein